MRDHPCFCKGCSVQDYDACSHKMTVGIWKSMPMTLKVIPKVYEQVPESLTEVTRFFDGAIRQSDPTIIIGLLLTENDDISKQLKYAVLSIPPRINVKGPISLEHTIDKMAFKINIGKGSAMIRAKILVKEVGTIGRYYLPPNSKSLDFPIMNIVDPTKIVSNAPLNRLTYVDYEVENMSYLNRNQKPCTQIMYTISESNRIWFESNSI